MFKYIFRNGGRFLDIGDDYSFLCELFELKKYDIVHYLIKQGADTNSKTDSY